MAQQIVAFVDQISIGLKNENRNFKELVVADLSSRNSFKEPTKYFLIAFAFTSIAIKIIAIVLDSTIVN